VAPGAYLWWYVDAISDDGRHALTVIAFVGSVFSPYYHWALRRNPHTPAEDHCAINVALYGPGARRWTMTERGRHRVQRSRSHFAVGPSSLRWDGACMVLDLHEWGMPWPQRVRGQLRVWPQALSTYVTALDVAGRHRWGPIAPCSRIEVELDQPALRWQGHAYLDSNEGDEPLAVPFKSWDWSRGTLRDGSSAVVYDVRAKAGPDHVIAQRFFPKGGCEPFEAPARQVLPRSAWRVQRHSRNEGTPARVTQTLEDTPFYVRSVLSSGLLGERVQSVHESLDVARLDARSTRLMLPWRMPRRA